MGNGLGQGVYGQAGHLNTGNRIIGVDMEDGGDMIGPQRRRFVLFGLPSATNL